MSERFSILISGDSDGYRQDVVELLARTEKLTDAESSTWLVYTLVAVPDPISAETLARLTTAADRTDSHWKPRLRAAIHFRRGEFQQAADLLDQHGGHPVFEFLATMAY